MYGWWYIPAYKPVQEDGYHAGYKESLDYIKKVLKEQVSLL